MSNLKKAAIWTTLLALVLKVSGFIREAIVSKQFGASAETDAYFLAFGFITLVVAMISTGFNNVFLPMYVKSRKAGDPNSDANANALLNWTMMLFFAVSFLGWNFAGSFVPFIYGDMAPATEVLAVEMTELFFAFMTVIALGALLDSYLQSRRIFVPSQVAKLLATLGAALFALLFSDVWGIFSLVYGFIAGTAVGVTVQVIALLRSDYEWKLTFKMDRAFRNTFIALIIPSLLNSVVGQINLFVNRYFASGTEEAAVTYLNNASLITSIPNAIYATTLAAIIFTLMSEQTDNVAKFRETVFRGMEVSVVTLVPIAVGLLVVGDAAVAFIYERGKFTPDDTANTYLVLLLYLPIIIFQGMQLILSKSMYARGKTAVVFRISVTTIAINIAMNWLLVDKYGYPALAVSASIVSVYYFTVSMIVVYNDLGMDEFKKFVRMASRVVLPATIMGLSVWGAKQLFGATEWLPIIQLAVLVPIGVIVYAIGLRIFYRDGFNRFVGLVRRS